MCIIQARLGSSRFPGKILENIDGIPMIVRIYKLLKTVCKTIVAIPYGESKTLGTFLWAHSVPYYEGHPENVLDRYYQAALRYPQYNYFLRITGDCPAPNIPLIHYVLNETRENEFDFVSNCFPPRTWPDGDDCELLSLKCLQWLFEKAKEPADREHVCTYFYNHIQEATRDGLTYLPVYNTWDASGIKTSIDLKKELETFNKIVVPLKTFFKRSF